MRVQNFNLWIMILFLCPFFAFAKTSYIQVIGTVKNPIDNLEAFYAEALGFEQYCKPSAQVQCKMFLNRDPKLPSPEADDTAKKVQGTYEKPTKNQILQQIEKSLLEAGPNDQVVLALSDHGIPGKISPSCVAINASELICVDDVKDVLRKKKPGTRVFVSVSACFSGNFADLSSREICTRVSGYRQKVTQALAIANTSFWDVPRYKGNFLDGKLTLSRAAEISKSNSTWSADFVGSQFILNELCTPLRMQLKNKGIELTGSYYSLSPISEAKVCEDRRELATIFTAGKNLKAVQNEGKEIFLKMFREVCKDLNQDNRILCDPLMKMLKSDLATKKVTEALEKIDSDFSLKLQALETKSRKIHSQIFQLERSPQAKREFAKRKKNPEAYIGSESQDGVFVNQILAKGLTPDIAKLEADLEKMKAEKDALLQERDEKARTIVNIPELNSVMGDLQQIRDCMSSELARPTERELKILKEKNIPERLGFPNHRKFTTQDFEDAKACEQQFSF